MNESNPDEIVESFVFYRSIRESIENMSAKNQLQTLLAIIDYALYSKEPDNLNGKPLVAFVLCRPIIDSNKKKRINGKKGGRPKKAVGEEEKENHRFQKAETNGYANEKPNEDEDEDEDVDVDVDEDGEGDVDGDKAMVSPGAPPPSREFVPPSLDDVSSYCVTQKLKVDPSGFIDYYESRGWMMGKSPMKDWQAAIRSWAKRDRQSGKTNAKERNYDEEVDFLGR